MDYAKNARNECGDKFFWSRVKTIINKELWKEVIDMPGGDATGPAGIGPMTGGGRGYCGLGSSPRNIFGFGPGLGPRGGGGRGRRNWFYAAGFTGRQRFQGGIPVMSREAEVQVLKEQAEMMTQRLENISARISELESAKDK